ncbi:ABC transporter permease [Nonomuraea rhizosphaerae]|uniref:ABC transporter permease n=1 Tax=Nonomuraea rhizosphaerae TaxID=2665663 RepID=UPI001C5F644C|nr:ABC transporter permease [Nonomuraea rhizosphaerae]
MMNVIRSEWTKIRSVRSTVWTLATTVLLMLGLGILISIATVTNAKGPIAPVSAAGNALSGIQFATVALAALGVIVISSEYRTGAIRVSLMAVPERLKLLTAKIVVFTALTLVVSLVTVTVTVTVGQLIMKVTPFSGDGVPMMVVGAALFLTACGLFGLALGTLIRHTPGAIVSAIALMLIVPGLMSALPGVWGETISDYVTTNAGMQIFVQRENISLGPWAGYGVYLAWVAVVMIAGAVLLRRRDA